MAATIGFIPIFLIIVVIAVIIGAVTKKWSKVAYASSGIFFLIGIIYAFNVENIPDLKDVLILFGLGFLISSINGLFKKK